MSHEFTSQFSVFDLFLMEWIMVILSKRCKTDNFKSHNSLKLSLANIRGLRSNFVECESFFESNFPDILALRVTSMDDSIDSGSFSVTGYLPLIRKDSVTHMDGLAVYLKEGLSFCMGPISWKLFRFSLMFSTGFTSLSVLFFSSIYYLFCLYARFLMLFFLT